MKAFWLLPLSLALASAAVPITACSSNQNHDERAATPEAKLSKPTSLPDQRTVCLGTCLPDPGSKAVDCGKEEAGFQYEWAWNWARDGKALATYTYDDNTPRVLLPERPGWEPLGDDINVCGLTKAVRFRGGPYTEYGGGFGTSFVTAAAGNGRARMPNLPASPEFPQDETEPFGGAYDLREWEGIAIWVRRGPNGQSTLRVGLTERNSAEDLNASAVVGTEVKFAEREGRYCQRYRLCGCPADSPCTEIGTNAAICWDPALGDPKMAPVVDENFHVIVRPLCGVARCKEANTSLLSGTDAKFGDRSCNEAYTSDGLTASYCYNPETDPTPPAKRERCGNPFSRPINVGLDWQLIRVPFTELRQADEADVALDLDLASVKQLVFTHTTGWVDFWIANIGFYRRPTQ